VAWTAARQHGVVSHAQLLDAGVWAAGVKHRVAAGWLHRVHRGVFAVGHPALTKHGRWAAATLACGPGSVLSHRSAAALWGIGRDADLAETTTVEELVKIIDNATNARRLGRTTMPSVIKGAKGRRGLKPLKTALLRTRPEDVLTRSELERRALRVIGSPKPEVDVRVDGYEVDLLWRAARLVVELDGSAYHDPERDTRKTNNLMARGWTVLRFTWRQVVNDPTWVVESLQAVRSRAACPASPSSSA